MKKKFSLSAALLSLTLILPACGPSGPKNQTFDASKLAEGQTSTISLKFWMENTGSTATGIRKNIHFDDASNNRIVFFFDETLRDKIANLKKGSVYTLTFTYSAGNPMNMGVVTAIN